MTAPGPRWAVLAFPLAALLTCAGGLRPGHVLLPTALDSLPPWSDAAGTPPARSNPQGADGLLITLPGRVYNHDRLRAGHLPFWNPYVFCGYPHLALIQNNALYPPTLPLDLLDPVSGLDHAAWLHLTAAGLLMYVFLRSTGLRRGAALLGGLAFELNGLFLVRLAVPSYLYSGTWLPLMLLGARAAAARGATRAQWALPLGVALSVLGGHPQIAMLAVLMAAAYGVWHVLTTPLARAGRARRVLRLAVLVVAGLGLSAYALLPFLELVAHSARDAVSLERYRRSAVPGLALVQAAWPDAFGHPVGDTYTFNRWASLLDGVPPDARYWGFNYTGQNLFTGPATLALAAVALLRARGRRDVALFGLAVLATLGVLLGTPLLDLAWAVLPGFRFSRPDRIVFVAMAALAILAAHAVEAPRGDELDRRRRRWIGVAALVLAAPVAWAALVPLARAGGRAALDGWLADLMTPAPEQPYRLAQLGAAVLTVVAVIALLRRRPAAPVPGRGAIAALAVLIALPNLVFAWRFNPAQPEPHLGGTAVERTLSAGAGGGSGRFARVLAGQAYFLPPNLAQLLRVHDVQGSSAAGLEGLVRLAQAADPSSVVGGKYFLAFRDPRVASLPLLSLLSVEWIASDTPLPLPLAGAESGAVRLYRNPSARPRFYLVSRAEPYDDVTEARARLLSAEFDARSAALLPTAEASGLRLAPAAVPAAGTVQVRRFEPHEIELEVESPAAAVLVSSEAAYPGWRSRVDGQLADTLLVNTAFRGVAVPAGRHRVTMEYVPRAFVAGVLISAGVLGVMLLAAARRW